MNRLIAALVGCALTVAMAGCATVMRGDDQQISVRTVAAGDGARITGASCTLSNPRGEWYVTSPGTVTVSRSRHRLIVECRHEQHGRGRGEFVPTMDPSLAGNILVGGVIGAAVDGATGAGMDYPSPIEVTLLAEAD